MRSLPMQFIREARVCQLRESPEIDQQVPRLCIAWPIGMAANAVELFGIRFKNHLKIYTRRCAALPLPPFLVLCPVTKLGPLFLLPSFSLTLSGGEGGWRVDGQRWWWVWQTG